MPHWQPGNNRCNDRIVRCTHFRQQRRPYKGFTRVQRLTYLVFMTLTTAGLGNVTAISPLSRSVAILIGLAGQLYMTILIAILVGEFLTGHEGK
ncbi:MAG TPA: potassium channel family protein [Azonexus sp.]|nr:potassium channel family protein [Azonexus sp.]